jgi:hypothetical protein
MYLLDTSILERPMAFATDSKPRRSGGLRSFLRPEIAVQDDWKDLPEADGEPGGCIEP